MNRTTKTISVLIISALLQASGAFTAGLQSYAWATMVLRNMRTMTAPEAMTQTFDGRHPCHLCLKVRKGADSEQSRLANPDERKLDGLIAAASPLPKPPMSSWAVGLTIDAANPVIAPVNVPPPRSLHA